MCICCLLQGVVHSMTVYTISITKKMLCLKIVASVPDPVRLYTGGRGCSLVIAGTYKPDVQLLLLQGHGAQRGSFKQPCFLPVASAAISPLLKSAFQEQSMIPKGLPASPRKEAPHQAIPESVQILPVDSQDKSVQVSVHARCIIALVVVHHCPYFIASLSLLRRIIALVAMHHCPLLRCHITVSLSIQAQHQARDRFCVVCDYNQIAINWQLCSECLWYRKAGTTHNMMRYTMLLTACRS